MDLLGVSDSVEQKFMTAVVLQYVSAMALLVIPFLFLGSIRSFDAVPTSQILLTGAVVLLATVAFFNTVLVVRRDILEPIVDMRESTTAIANGRFDTPPPERDQRDETGELKASFAEMYDYLTTVVEQADAIRQESFDDPVLEEEVPGEFGNVLREMQTTLRRRIRDLQTFKEAVERIGTGIAVYDENGCLVYTNRAYAEMLGTTTDRLEGRHIAEINPEVDASEFRGYWESFDVGETRRAETVHHRFDDGTEFPVSVTTTHVSGEDGEFHVGTITDISERKEHERRLRELHEATRQLVEADDRETIAELTAEAAREILGYESAVVRLVTSAGKLHPVAITERARAEMGSRPDYPLEGENLPARAVERGEPLLVTDPDDVEAADDWPFCSAMYLPIDGHGALSITDTAADAFDDADVTLASVLASNAETALNRLEREHEIRRQNERLEKFGRTVAHDLRNPIHLIEGYLDVATLSDCPEEAHEEIGKAANRMTELVDGLLELAKKGQTVIDPSSEPIDSVAEAAWEQVETSSMTLDVAADDHIMMDRSRGQQVLENLFRNAREHAGTDVTVRVGTFDGGFYVEDDGPGIPPKLRDDVFDSGVTSAEDGTGFGLAIVKQIADAHNWTVTVTDGSDGGARFEFSNVDLDESPDLDEDVDLDESPDLDEDVDLDESPDPGENVGLSENPNLEEHVDYDGGEDFDD